MNSLSTQVVRFCVWRPRRREPLAVVKTQAVKQSVFGAFGSVVTALWQFALRSFTSLFLQQCWLLGCRPISFLLIQPGIPLTTASAASISLYPPVHEHCDN